MKRLIIVCLSVAGLIGLSGCATSQPAAGTSAMPAAVTASTDAKQADRYCVRDTGSRIATRQKKTETAEDFAKRCLAFNGRVYTREDIARTGEVDLAEALRKLDPAIH